MGGLGRIIGVLVGVVLLVFAGTAVADDDDDDKPGVYTLSASEIGPSGSLLRAFVHPNGRSTTYYFEYGATTAYGSQTATASAGSGDDWKFVSTRVEGLQPSTTYHFRVVATNSRGTSHGSDRSFTTLAAGASTPPPGGDPASGQVPPGDTPDGPKPDLGRSVALEPSTGVVLVRRRGSSKFVRLTSGSELPVGSEVDAGEGALDLTSALPSGDTQTGRFGGGRFLVRQGRRGYVDLHLRGRICPRPAGAAAAAGRSGGRRLWGRDRGGRFRTHGKNSHATVRGTRWLVEDRCAGTLTRVTQGSVVVRDEVRGKRVVVEAGERYLARPRR